MRVCVVCPRVMFNYLIVRSDDYAGKFVADLRRKCAMLANANTKYIQNCFFCVYGFRIINTNENRQHWLKRARVHVDGGKCRFYAIPEYISMLSGHISNYGFGFCAQETRQSVSVPKNGVLINLNSLNISS